MPRTMKYRDRIEFDRNAVLVADWDGYKADIEQFVTGIGFAVERDETGITFEVEADDLWDLHEKVTEIVTEANSRGIFRLSADKEKVLLEEVAA